MTRPNIERQTRDEFDLLTHAPVPPDRGIVLAIDPDQRRVRLAVFRSGEVESIILTNDLIDSIAQRRPSHGMMSHLMSPESWTLLQEVLPVLRRLVAAR